tara:strand:- start:599 stop:904 length:306 start_codon:yes stop_codon:yes gene_type:complete
MNFFKNAVYVLVFINLVSLGFNGWMYKELHEPDIIMASDPALHTLIEECRARDTHILKAILLTHHRLGIHQPTQQDMCPACDDLKEQMKDSSTKTIKYLGN